MAAALIDSSFRWHPADVIGRVSARTRRPDLFAQTAWMPMAKNERKTENIVRDELRRLGYYDEANDIQVEEQKSVVEAVKKSLRAASKSCLGGCGSPEFIVTSAKSPDFVLIVECKAAPLDHSSPLVPKLLTGTAGEETPEDRARRIQRFAVDGVLNYAAHLSREFNVIAVAVAGESKASATVSSFLHTKGTAAPKELRNKSGKPIDKLIPWPDYIEHATFDPTVQRLRFDELMAFSRDLHEFMRDHAKLTESEKPLLVSGTLIALKNDAFAQSYGLHTPEELQKEWLRVIQKEIFKAKLPRAKKANMTQPYSSIAVHPELGKPTKGYPRGILHELITRLNEKAWPFISIYHDFDVVGRFYGEFLKYTGGDKKSLGIVLTPRHLTELFALLANVNKDSVVLDICAGTGGFLVSAMHQMMKSAATEAEQTRIKQKGLIGIEQQPNMFALAASNMILRGDGKANLFQGSCFDRAIVSEVRKRKCNVGLLNPPFSQSDDEQHELRFIKQMLDCLRVGGTGVAVAPISCAIAPHPARAELLKHHTLEAVMSLPTELFYPVGTITCAMVLTAHVPHAQSNRKTWFGYWKNDGFVKTKHRGRIDLHNKWPAIRDRWVESFRNREVHSGESITHQVTEADEWCAEAYMETDYSTLTQTDFERELKRYILFQVLREDALAEGDEVEEAE